MFWISVFCLFFQLLLSSEIPPYLIEPLSGGYSGSHHYRIDQKFVLKLYPNGYPGTKQAQRELSTMQAAAASGLAPKIHWISADQRAVLMDCMEGSWLTIEEAKKPHNLIAIAHALHKVHTLPKSPLRRPSVDLFEYLKALYPFPAELEIAVKNKHELSENCPKVTIHGDLNPRNIFLTKEGVKFIDWSETTWADPFLDLATFALLHDLNHIEEMLLLHTYLGNGVLSEHLERYNLIKKNTLLDEAINLIFLANELAETELQNGPLRDWAYYTAQFAESKENLSPQMLYDWGRCCLLKKL